MTIDARDFQVPVGKKVDLKKWPTKVEGLFESKEEYKEILEKHIKELSALQQLHYASGRYALLLIFPGHGRRRQGWRNSARHVRR